jgi:predicted lysophospholipase L1 biosynthesis ABC-type transport system permease subunit
MPFAMAYMEGAAIALVTILVLLMVFMSGTPRAAAILAGSVFIACLAMWIYARQSAIVRYANEREKRAATWPHRLLGLVFGVATSVATHIIIQTTSL